MLLLIWIKKNQCFICKVTHICMQHIFLSDFSLQKRKILIRVLMVVFSCIYLFLGQRQYLFWSIRLVPRRLILFLYWTHRLQWRLHGKCWISSLGTNSKHGTHLPSREGNQLNKQGTCAGKINYLVHSMDRDYKNFIPNTSSQLELYGQPMSFLLPYTNLHISITHCPSENYSFIPENKKSFVSQTCITSILTVCI